MTTQPIDLNEESPLLTEVVSDSSSDNLPILTDVVVEPIAVSEPSVSVIPAFLISEPPPRTLSAEEMQQLLQHIETHLENVFTSKLNSQLERLQHLAVDLAVSEFKAELPQLLRDALNKTDESGKWSPGFTYDSQLTTPVV
jgi:hypothetical protein